MKHKSLTKVIETNFDIQADTPEFNFIYAVTISYLTNAISAFEYQKLIFPYLKGTISAKVFRLTLMKSKYTGFVLKLFVLQLSSIRVNDEDGLKSLAAEMGIHKRDVYRIHAVWKCSSKLRKYIRSWYSQLPDHSTPSLRGLDDLFSKVIYPRIVKPVKSIARKRLTFIVKPSNLDITDLQNDLLVKAVQAFYKEVPTVKSIDHLVNFIVRSVDNHAVNMIYQATSQKRGRLVCLGFDKYHEREFSLLEVAENQMIASSSTTGEAADDFSLQNQEYCSVNPTEKIDNEICVTTILDKYKTKTKKYRLLLILMGNVDVQFTEWLRSKRHCSIHEDNSDLQERIGTLDFRKLVSQFLHIDDDKVNVFLFKLSKTITEKNESKQCSSKKRTTRRYVTASHTYYEKPKLDLSFTRKDYAHAI